LARLNSTGIVLAFVPTDVRILADLKYSTRSLVRSPGLAFALLLTIAIGVGSNAAVFGFVRGLVSRDIPLAHRDRLVSIYARESDGGFGPLSQDEFRTLENQAGAFETVGVLRESHASLVVGDRLTVRSAAAISPQIAELLQLPPGIVISHRLWRSELGSKSDLQSVPIRVDGIDARIAGVAPEWLEGLYVDRAVDVWMPIGEIAPAIDSTSRTFWALARLRDGVSADQAQQTLIAAQAATGGALAVQPYTGATPDAGAGLARVNRSLVAAAIAVFFMACANVAVFLLSRATARSHETSVRVALGAGRPQLRRQLLADSVLIAGAGGACGLILAFWTMELIPSLFFDQHAEQLIFAPDINAILIGALVCAVLMAACGLVPLLQVRDDRPALVLVREGRGPSNAMRRLRTGLVVAQMTCCSLLVISTALLIDGFRAALRTSAGQRLGDAMLATVDARDSDYFSRLNGAAAAVSGTTVAAWMSTPPGSRASWSTLQIEPPNLPTRDAVMDAVALTPQWLDWIELPPRAGRMFGRRDAPGGCRATIVNDVAAEAFFDGDAVGRSIVEPAGSRVEIVGVISTPRREHRRPLIFYYPAQTDLPSDSATARRFQVPVRPPPVAAVLSTNVVSASYFEAIALPLTDGQLFGDAPAAGGCRAAVMNEEAAQRFFGGRAGGAVIDRYGQRTEIVGVVRARALRLAERRSGPTLYLPVWQDFMPQMTMMVGSREVDDDQLQLLRRRLTAVQGGMVRRVVSLEQHLSVTALAPERIAATLVGVSALMALVLGVLGMYSAMADSMRQRRREVALRIALGARGWRLIRQVLVEGFTMAVAGAFGGVIASVAVARWLELTPPTLRPGLWVFVIAPLALTAAVLFASVVPMRRALAVDPLTIMRDA
jgi:putative ABC transport system permease protein